MRTSRVLSPLFVAATAMPQANWQLEPTSPSPSGREAHSLVHDPVSQRTFLHRGRSLNGFPPSDRTWMWDGSTWSPTSYTSAALPQPVGSAGIAVESAGGLLEFGGYYPGFGIGGGNPLVFGNTDRIAVSATFALNATTLTLASAPAARHGLQLASTPQGALLFGGTGATSTGAWGDTWLWNGSSWLQLAPASSPPPRYHHAMAYDSVRQVVVLFSGSSGGGQALDDTWEWDGTDWQQRFPLRRPPARARAAFAFDPVRGRCVLFGGGAVDFSSSLGDTWTWDGTDWQLIPAPSAPAARQSAAMIFEPSRQQMMLFGGRAGVTMFGDTWFLDLALPTASYTPFGSGCPGPNGSVPTMSVPPNQLPRLGSTSQLVVGNLPVGLTLPVFVLGLSNTFDVGGGHPLPFDLGLLGWPGCQQLVSHEVMDPVPTLSGTASRSMVVPPNGSLLGASFHAQALALYVPSNAAVSNAVTGVVGL